MPDPAPVAPAPDAVAPTPTPTPPPAPAPTPTPAPDAKPTSKELAGKLFSLLTAPAPGADEPPKPKVKDTPPPTPTPPKADTPAPVPDDKEIKRRKKDTPPAPGDAPPPIPKKSDLAPTPTPTPAATPAATKTETDAEFEKSLVEEERALLEDARSAEKYLGEKYKSHGTKMAAFLKENAKKLNDPNFDAEDPAYQKWYNDNLPKIGALDFRKMERERVKEDVKQEFEPKIAEERHARWVDTEAPKIKAKGNEIYGKLANSALPDEVSAAIAERTKGITDRAEYVKKVQEVQKDYALEFEIAETVINTATNDIEEFHRLTTTNPATGKSIVAFDAANEQHERLVTMVTQLCNDFKATGGAELKKEGKWFVTREEWQNMAPEQRAPFWTFTNEQLMERAMGNVKKAVTMLVTQEHKRLEGRGFKRTIVAAQAPAPAPAPTPTPAPGAPPAPRPAPVAPGGAPQPSIAATLAGKLTSQPS